MYVKLYMKSADPSMLILLGNAQKDLNKSNQIHTNRHFVK